MQPLEQRNGMGAEKDQRDPRRKPEWKHKRKVVLERDGHVCCNCNATSRGEGGADLQVHHIVPVSQGGTNKKTNLKTICRECHYKVHAATERYEKLDLNREDFDSMKRSGKWLPAVAEDINVPANGQGADPDSSGLGITGRKPKWMHPVWTRLRWFIFGRPADKAGEQ